MEILVAGLGDIGGPLAVRALRKGHSVTGLDTWHEHAHRLEYLKMPLRERLPQPWQSLREMEHHGMYEQLYAGDPVPEFDVAIVTPNCMINDAPHIRWNRFDRELRMIGAKLRKGNTVILHCLSLQGAAMMQSSEEILYQASGGLEPRKDYCLAWTGLLDGEYQMPESQDLFVDGREKGCTSKAKEVMDELVASVTTLEEMQKTKTDA